MQKSHKGFAVLEALLVFVILAIIGGTGYFVWHSRQVTDKTLSDTNKSTNSNVAAISDYLVVKEWDIKIKLHDADKLTYTYTSQSNGSSYGSQYDSNINISTPGAKDFDVVFRSVHKPVSQDVNGYPSVDKTVFVDGYYYWTQGANLSGTGADDALVARVHEDLVNITANN